MENEWPASSRSLLSRVRRSFSISYVSRNEGRMKWRRKRSLHSNCFQVYDVNGSVEWRKERDTSGHRETTEAGREVKTRPQSGGNGWSLDRRLETLEMNQKLLYLHISQIIRSLSFAILISVLSCRFTLLTFTFYIRILLIFEINLLVFCNLKTAQKILILELHEKPFKDLLILDYEVISPSFPHHFIII